MLPATRPLISRRNLHPHRRFRFRSLPATDFTKHVMKKMPGIRRKSSHSPLETSPSTLKSQPYSRTLSGRRTVPHGGEFRKNLSQKRIKPSRYTLVSDILSRAHNFLNECER